MCGIHRTKFRSWIWRMVWIGGCADFGGISTTAVVWVLLDIFWLSVIGGFLGRHGAVSNRTYQLRAFSREITHASIGCRSISAHGHSPSAPVNVDCLTSNVRSIVAEEKSDRSCYLFRSTAAFHDAGPDRCLL